MFLGEYQHTVDNKGRVIIPARFREGLGSCFIIAKGLDHCLFLYSPEEWAQLEEKLRSISFTRADARAFNRFFFSGASEAELDRQGRILLPPALRLYAELERDAVFIGVSNRVEIWSVERWEHYRRQAETAYEQLAERMVDLDL